MSERNELSGEIQGRGRRSSRSTYKSGEQRGRRVEGESRRELWGGKKPACEGGGDHRTGTCDSKGTWRPAKSLIGNHRYMSLESYQS